MIAGAVALGVVPFRWMIESGTQAVTRRAGVAQQIERVAANSEAGDLVVDTAHAAPARRSRLEVAQRRAVECALASYPLVDDRERARRASEDLDSGKGDVPDRQPRIEAGAKQLRIALGIVTNRVKIHRAAHVIVVGAMWPVAEPVDIEAGTVRPPAGPAELRPCDPIGQYPSRGGLDDMADIVLGSGFRDAVSNVAAVGRGGPIADCASGAARTRIDERAARAATQGIASRRPPEASRCAIRARGSRRSRRRARSSREPRRGARGCNRSAPRHRRETRRRRFSPSSGRDRALACRIRRQLPCAPARAAAAPASPRPSSRRAARAAMPRRRRADGVG